MKPKFVMSRGKRQYSLPSLDGMVLGLDDGQEYRVLAGLTVEIFKLKKRITELENKVQVLAMNVPLTNLPEVKD